MSTPWQVWLYVAAVLIPFVAFWIQLLFLRRLRGWNAYIATGAIASSCVLALLGFFLALPALLTPHHAPDASTAHASNDGNHAAEPDSAEASHAATHAPTPPFLWRWSYDWVALGANIAMDPEAPGRPGVPARPPLVVPIGVSIDSLAVIMFLMVTFVATLIHIYSMGYMAEDPRYPLFFAYLSLFCFSMLGLVASSNVFMIFMFWELVGVCSYLLIGFWFEEKKNADAANKAFIVNRVGDVGMLIGLGVIWTSLGTFDFQAINRALADPVLRNEQHELTRTSAGLDVTLNLEETSSTGSITKTTRTVPYWALIVAGLGVFAGCVGKSAQFPLHVWLPDAMAGPTPVSALIHAATMVAAGVYLVGRFFPLFTYEVMLTIAYAGGITLFMAATIALVQTDYKKVLAYSTVSQLGFMILALGVGGWAAGLFHLLTHAFFKALLFLGAGSVYHSVHTYEMPKLGGLWKNMPITAKTMLVGTLAIAGVPLFSGFYSKDAILGNALRFSNQHPEHLALFLLPAVGAFITAFYMFRMWFLLFDGESRSATTAVSHSGEHTQGHAHGHDLGGDPVAHAHESPPIMTYPLIVLAAFAVFVGYPITLIPFGSFEPVLEGMLATAEPLPIVALGSSKWVAMFASIVIAAAGIALAWAFYSSRRIFSSDAVARAFDPVYRLFANKWYFDEIYDAIFVQPTLTLTRICAGIDRRFIDGIVNGSAGITVVMSKLNGVIDKFAVDGLVNLVGWISLVAGDVFRRIQTGRLRSYLGLLALAIVLIFSGVFLWIR
jgi:proton-translocating NADH-quinone oxidoreductase chain L